MINYTVILKIDNQALPGFSRANTGLHFNRCTDIKQRLKGKDSRFCARASDNASLLFMSQLQTKSELKRECECVAISQLAVDSVL